VVAGAGSSLGKSQREIDSITTTALSNHCPRSAIANGHLDRDSRAPAVSACGTPNSAAPRRAVVQELAQQHASEIRPVIFGLAKR
jgi:hypothetical protein